MRRTALMGGIVSVLALATLAGCGQAGADDPASAQDVLRQALEAWKGGTAYEAARDSTGIVVSDPDWSAGSKLVRYEIGTEAVPEGFDLKCPVELWMEDGEGRPTHQKVFYTLSTHPTRTVVRAAFDGPVGPLEAVPKAKAVRRQARER